jgi:hypothetical protein
MTGLIGAAPLLAVTIATMPIRDGLDEQVDA